VAVSLDQVGLVDTGLVGVGRRVVRRRRYGTTTRSLGSPTDSPGRSALCSSFIERHGDGVIFHRDHATEAIGRHEFRRRQLELLQCVVARVVLHQL
jgi:hypothetical protein